MPSTSPLWPGGGAVLARPRPLASPGTTVAVRRRLGVLSQSGGQSHTNHTPSWVLAASPPPGHARGEWHSPQYSSIGTPGTARRDVARCRQEEPLRITIQRGSRPQAASRDAACDTGLRQPIARALRGPFGGPGGGPIGVVKLLRARGGCLGVIRFGRGRLRKVRGSCPTSVEPGMPEQPGELKHLSTRRNGNQPRLPQ